MRALAGLCFVAGSMATQAQADSPAPATGESLSGQDRVAVSTIRVNGNSVFSPAEIATITAPYTNRTVTIEELQTLRLDISKRYAERNYINSGVILPDQTVVDGVVELNAVEGNLTRIDIVGDPRLRDSYLTSRIRQRVKAPLNTGELEETLKWLQTDEHVRRLDAQLLPGTKLGESVLRIAVEEPEIVTLGVSADNQSSSSVGSERGRLNVDVRNLTGFGETLTASTAFTEGANDASASLQVPVSPWNTRVKAYYGRSDSKIIERQVRDLDIESLTTTRGIDIEQPLIDRIDTTLALNLGLEKKDSATSLSGIPFSFSPGAQDGRSKTSVAQLGASWSQRGANNLVSFRAVYRKGIDAFDATVFDPSNDFQRAANPTGADGVFSVVVAQALYLQRLNRLSFLSNLDDRGQLVLRTTAQFASDPLLSLEKFAVGGADSVRGYSENLLVRDNGLVATAELQLPIPGYHPEPHPLNLVVAPFIDYGRSHDEVDTDPTVVRNTAAKRTIVGAGVGLLWEPMRGVRAQLYWGSDVSDNFDRDDPRTGGPNDLQADGVHFSVSYRYAF